MLPVGGKVPPGVYVCVLEHSGCGAGSVGSSQRLGLRGRPGGGVGMSASRRTDRPPTPVLLGFPGGPAARESARDA